MYIITEQMKDRINILRWILIIFVIYIHADTLNIVTIPIDLPDWFIIFEIFLSRIIARTAVPLFFIISSILLYNSYHKYSYKENLIKKLSTLVIPYIFWNCFWIIVFFIGQNISILSSFFSNPEKIIKEFDYQKWLHAFGIIKCNGSTYPFLYPFWFIRDLILLNIISPIIKFLVDKLPNLILCLAFFMYISGIKFGVLSSESLFYFTVGCYLVKKDITFEKIDYFITLKVILIYIITSFMAIFFDLNPLLLKMNILIGVLVMIKVSKVISGYPSLNSIILKLSAYTFFVYAIHEWTLSFSRKIILKIFDVSILSILFTYFILPVIVIISSIFLAKMIEKISPKFYKLINGGR